MVSELQAQTAIAARSAITFMGEPSCSSSTCHGGAGEKHNQFLTWSKLDFHSRAHATLTTARSARIADSLKIGNPVESANCTVCHSPLKSVAEKLHSTDSMRGVSCETCHGSAKNWLRSHTRPDWTHEDRVHAGMHDLKNLYVRANTCVSCHQNVNADLLQAGHPELIFELDGQAVTEPKHWREKSDWSGPQTWLVGQAVALREMSWQLSQEKSPAENAVNRWSALLWLLSATEGATGLLPANEFSSSNGLDIKNATSVQKWSDQLALKTAEAKWSAEWTRKCLNTLSGTAKMFRGKTPTRTIQARRAERLVLALDRLANGLNDEPAAKQLSPVIDRLFKDVQSLPDFDPAQFAGHLEEFQKSLPSLSESK
ncbi:MAG: hypothetical protein JWQ71_2172 [Pedosphaera sp.]|nr:hypothetical protein [Pedosphaera sp.]